MRRLRLATRGSRLATTQSRWVADRLKEARPDLEVELVEIRTRGDVLADVPLVPALGQSFFTKEIEDALLDGRADLAVHSCKDLATRLPEGLVIGATPEREDPRDVLVGPAGGLDALPRGARVGTSSLRRRAFLAAVRPDLELREQRGNVPTRLKAVEEGRVDAVVLAAAGLARLGLPGTGAPIEADVLLPAAAQGALAVQVRRADPEVAALVARIDHAPTRAAVEAERACLRRLEAGCQAPVGVLAEAAEGALRIRAAVATPDGVIRTERRAAPEHAAPTGPGTTALEAAAALGVAAAEDLLERLGVGSFRELEWAGPPPRAGEGER